MTAKEELATYIMELTPEEKMEALTLACDWLSKMREGKQLPPQKELQQPQAVR